MNSFKKTKYFLWVKKKNRNKGTRLRKGVIFAVYFTSRYIKSY